MGPSLLSDGPSETDKQSCDCPIGKPLHTTTTKQQQAAK